MIVAKSNWSLEDYDFLFNDACYISFNDLKFDIDCKYNILVITEPKEILQSLHPEIAKIFYSNKDVINFIENVYDLVLTWDEYLLSIFSNSSKYLWGSSWIKDISAYENKKDKISFLTTWKRITETQILRQEIFYKMNKYNMTKIGNEFEYFQHMSPPNIDPLECLHDFKYTIVIENAIHKNWFTEKIIDAFITKTIPIYYGCPNISDFFDLNGILCFTNINDLFDIISNIKKNDYENKKFFIEKNYILAKKYINPLENIKKQINFYLFENNKIGEFNCI